MPKVQLTIKAPPRSENLAEAPLNAWRRRIKLAAFSLIEVLLSISLFSIFVMMLVMALLQSQENATLTGSRLRAVQYAEEGIEATRSIKNENFEGLVDGDYGLAFVGSRWTLSGTQDTQDGFTRTVNISTISESLKRIRVTISWPQTSVRIGSLSFESYLSNWAQPQQGDWTDPIPDPEPLPDNIAALKIQTQGNYAYLIRGNQTANFIIINVTNPASPQIIATLDLPGGPTNIAISGNYAFISNKDKNQNLQVVDITDPNNPRFDSAWTFRGIGNEPATSMALSGNRVYLTREFKEISVSPTFYAIDVTTPTSPKELGYIRLKDPVNGYALSAFDVYVSGNYAFVAGGYKENETTYKPYLQVIDVTNPQPVVKATYPLFDPAISNLGYAIAIAGYDNTIAVGQDNPANNVYIFDIANPLNLIQRAIYNASGKVNDLCFGPNSNYTYLATEAADKEFQLIDVSNPSSPSLVGSSDLAGILNGISYSSSKDRVFAVGNQDQGQFVVISPK
ncbi:MAG: hypothetical protein OEV37_02950 [Candidatus Berkelbacteria bacterium]|nr:hypothetical protein [Candidatus Berkelbacteria bacterium]